MEDFYANLKKLLDDDYTKGFTYQEIADRRGTSPAQIQRLRIGKISFEKMRVGTLLKIFPEITIRSSNGNINTNYGHQDKVSQSIKSEGSGRALLDRIMSCEDIPAEVKVKIYNLAGKGDVD